MRQAPVYPRCLYAAGDRGPCAFGRVHPRLTGARRAPYENLRPFGCRLAAMGFRDENSSLTDSHTKARGRTHTGRHLLRPNTAQQTMYVMKAFALKSVRISVSSVNDIDQLNIKTQILSCQRMVEIHGHFRLGDLRYGCVYRRSVRLRY
jgi:hypothetical protein